jgi:zinc-binding in reverse transcriptase
MQSTTSLLIFLLSYYQIIWRWNFTGFCTTKSCYEWLEFEGINNQLYKKTWSAHIPLKIKVFLWLIQKNNILTRDNLSKRGWTGTKICIFCSADEIMEHLFIHCSVASCIWSWIAHYNKFSCHSYCNTIEELWRIDHCILFKDKNLWEMIRETVLRTIWNERNRLIF